MKAEELLAVAGGAVVKLSGLDGRKEEVQANAECKCRSLVLSRFFDEENGKKILFLFVFFFRRAPKQLIKHSPVHRQARFHTPCSSPFR